MGENEQEPAPGKPDAYLHQTPSGIQPILSPRRSRPGERDESESRQDERLAELNNLVDRVHTLSEQMGGTAPSERPPALETREKPLRRWKKVVRLGVDPLRGQPGPATEEVPASASSLAGSLLALPASSPEKSAAGDVAESGSPAEAALIRAAAHAPPAYVPRRATGARRPRAASRRAPLMHRYPFLVWVAAQAFCFALVLAGAWIGQYSAAPKAPAPESGSAENTAKSDAASGRSFGFVSEQAFQKINEALAVGKKDAAAAQRLLDAAERQRVEIPGTAYRLALIAIQQGDQTQAEVQLDRAAGIPELRAAAAYISAAVNGSHGDFTRTATMLETAVYAEPFSARYLFFWGEALRRAGRLKEAIERLEWAQSRPASPADAELIALKLRLAKIEAGRESEFAAESESKLKIDPIPAYWLLTAAAQEVQRGDYPAAARFLQKAARSLPAEELNQQMRDYFFTPLAARKEFAPYFARSGPLPVPLATIGLNSDPATWTMQSGDPAAWSTGGPVKVH